MAKRQWGGRVYAGIGRKTRLSCSFSRKVKEASRQERRRWSRLVGGSGGMVGKPIGAIELAVVSGRSGVRSLVGPSATRACIDAPLVRKHAHQVSEIVTLSFGHALIYPPQVHLHDEFLLCTYTASRPTCWVQSSRPVPALSLCENSPSSRASRGGTVVTPVTPGRALRVDHV